MRPYVIAEIASAHEGDVSLAKRMAASAAESGADAVKMQIFRRDALISTVHPKFGSFGEIELQPHEWREVVAVIAKADVDLIVEVYDEASLELAEAMTSVDAYKFPTSDIANLAFLQRVAGTGKPIYVGMGGATLDEVRRAVEVARKARGGQITLVHGFQAYPTRVVDADLGRIAFLKREFDLPVCYADHTDAEAHELARALPALALAFGATSIEKHFTDDRSRKGRDHYSALQPGEFRDFVAYLAQVSDAFGVGSDTLSDAERVYRQQMKRNAVAAESLPAGTVLNARHIAYKRTNAEGLSPAEGGMLIGKRLVVEKRRDEPLTGADLT